MFVYALLNMSDAHRKARLKHLIATDYGSLVAFAAAVGKGKARVSQMAGPNQPFGERAARHLEEAALLPAEWFNNDWPTPHETRKLGHKVAEPQAGYHITAKSITASAESTSARSAILALGEVLRAMDSTDRDIATLILRDLASDPTKAHEMAEKFDRLLGGNPKQEDQRKAG
jgi:hypothetical protein